jgi:hypothetical protein
VVFAFKKMGSLFVRHKNTFKMAASVTLLFN